MKTTTLILAAAAALAMSSCSNSMMADEAPQTTDTRTGGTSTKVEPKKSNSDY